MKVSSTNVYVLEPDGRLSALLATHFSTQISLNSVSTTSELLTCFYQNSSPTAEIVILVVGLNQDDLELIHNLKKRAPNTEVIVITDSQDHHAVLKTLREEVPHVFEAPINESEFLRFVDTQLQRIVVVGSRNFANYDARKNASDTWFFNMKAYYTSMVDELEESASKVFAGDIAEIRHHFQIKRAENKYTVLSVDDEPDIRSGIRLNLRKLYNVLEAENGSVAFDLLSEHSEIDVVLLDVRMPGEWGNLLLPKIKALRPDVEVIMLTAYEETSIAIETFQNGTYEYLNKPFTRAQLLDCVYRALNVKLTRQFGSHLPLSERLLIFEEYYAIKCCLKQPVTYAELGMFFREILLLDIPGNQELKVDGQPIAQVITDLVLKVEKNSTLALEQSRDRAVELTLEFTKNPTDENRAKMQDALNQLGRYI